MGKVLRAGLWKVRCGLGSACPPSPQASVGLSTHPDTSSSMTAYEKVPQLECPYPFSLGGDQAGPGRSLGWTMYPTVPHECHFLYVL